MLIRTSAQLRLPLGAKQRERERERGFSHTLWNKRGLFTLVLCLRECSFGLLGAQTPITKAKADPQLRLALGQGWETREKKK